MITLFNNSVKNITSGITSLVTNLTSENSQYNIDLCVIEQINLNFLKCDNVEEIEKMNKSKETLVIIVLHSNFYLNLYHLEENLELKCFFSNKFLFPISLIEVFSLGMNKTYSKDLPLLALISNKIFKNNQVQFSTNDYLLKLYSIKSKRVVHTLRFKKQIINFISRGDHFAVSLSDFTIKLFENDKMTNIFTVKPRETIFPFQVSPKKFTVYENSENEVISECKFFDISDNVIVYYNDIVNFDIKFKENHRNLSDINSYSPYSKSNSYTIGNMTADAMNGLTKLKDWSINQVKEYSNLKQAYTMKNNTDLDISKNGCFINIQKLSDKSGQDIKKIFCPFFNDGISIIKFFHAYKYLIIGNKNAQIFYIYEFYPSTNLKINDNNVEYNYRILFSLYRGITNATVNNIDWSSCRNFLSISSKKGTIHVYYLPKIESQLYENNSKFNYRGFHDVYNNVTQAIKIDKIKLGSYFNSNLPYQSYVKILSNFKIDIEALSREKRELLSYSKTERYVNFPVLLCLCDKYPSLHAYVLIKDNLRKDNGNRKDHNQIKCKEIIVSNYYAIHLKEVSYLLNFKSHKNDVDPNYLELIKKSKLNDLSTTICKKGFKLKEQIELETTEKNYAPLQINPLFTFNLYKSTKKLPDITLNNRIHKKSLDNSNMSAIHDNQPNNANKKSQNCLLQVYPKKDINDNSSSLENQRKSINNNLNNSKRNMDHITYKIDNEGSHENVILSSEYLDNPQNLKKKSINNTRFSNQNHVSSYNHRNFNSFYINKGKTNSSNVRNYSNYDDLDNNNNSSLNDIQVSENFLCHEIEYVNKQFNYEKRIKSMKSDNLIDNMVFQPKLIIPPNQYFNYNKIPCVKLNSSNSDKSSSNNSLGYINNNIDNITQSNIKSSACSKNNNEKSDELETKRSIHMSFFKERENFIENQIKLAMETNIIENFKINEAQVKIYNEYKIDDNYLTK